MNISARFLFSVLGFLLLSLASFGQTNARLHWYFSTNTNNIFFDQNTLEPRLETVPNTLNPGQSGVVSDLVTGELIFYTDGNEVYDRLHRLVANGTGLEANPQGPQAVAVSAVPGAANLGQFYIFTNSASLGAAGNIRYSVYDTALYGAGGFPSPPAGDISLSNQTIAGLADNTSSPAMIVIPNAAFDGFWLITHTRNTEDYRVTEIANDGSIGATTIYTIPGAPQIAHTISASDSATVFAGGLRTLAISPQDNRPVTLISLDPTDGSIDTGNPVFIPNTSTSQLANENIFDTEFSSGGRYLYISGNLDDTIDSLVQVDLQDPTFQLRPLPVAAGLQRSYGLQRGPDDRIYHLYDGGNLGRINEPDSAAVDAFYSRNSIGNNLFPSRQFAAFQPLIRPVLELEFSIAGDCANSPIFFLPSVKPSADSIIWDFGDGNFARAYAPRHAYESEGAYNVTMIAFSNGFPQATSQPLNVRAFDFQINNIPQDTVVCPEDFPLQFTAEGSGQTTGNATFRWNNQMTDGPTTTIDSAGSYYVVATAPNGCSTHAPMEVREYGAQEQRSNIWYFGQNAGIDFNPIVFGGAPVAIPFNDPTIYNGGNQMIAPEGCAIFCDPNGFPIFYSDGQSVYDREGNLVAELSGSPDATQSVLLLQYPGDVTLYYIFTTQEIFDASGNRDYELRYSIFDLKLRNGLGDVVRNAANEPIEETLMCNSTERLSGNEQWVIAHEYGNNLFRAYQLTGDGIQAPVISQIGSIHNSAIESAGRGYMRLSNLNTLALNLPTGGNNFIEIFDFENGDGTISEFRQVDVNQDFSVAGNLYGLEFSGDGRKIFASLNGGSESYIVEYWLDSLGNPVPQPDEPISSSFTIGAIQAGPDGQLYVAMENENFLGTIVATPDTSLVSQFQETGFPLAPGTSSELGLPNFISQYGTPPPATSLIGSNGCPGEDIAFEAVGSSTFDIFTWNIRRVSDNNVVEGPVTTGPAQTSSYTFNTDEPGQYEATVLISNECSNSIDTLMRVPFTVFDRPSADLIPTDASACGLADGQLDVNINFTGPYHYTIRDNAGQILDAGFDVTDPTLSATNLAGGVYSVFIEEQTNGCSNTFSVTVQENPSFQITSTSTVNTNCDGEDGQVNFNVDANANLPIDFALFNQETNNQVATGNVNAQNGTIPGLTDGTYYLQVTDLTGCNDFVNNIVVQRPDTIPLLTDRFVSACDVTEITIGAQSPATTIEWTYGTNTFQGDSITVDAPGVYTVTAFGDNLNNCDNTKQVNVEFGESSPNPFRDQYTICPEDPIAANTFAALYAGNRFVTAEYYLENGTLIDENTPGFEFVNDSLYVFTIANIEARLTNSFGCETIAEIAIIESCEARITAPNAFRPGSINEINTAFRIYSQFVDENNFQILVFNRWGEIVFESEDINFRWNGGNLNNPGEPLPQGTYAYIIRYISRFEPQLGTQTEKGAVILLR